MWYLRTLGYSEMVPYMLWPAELRIDKPGLKMAKVDFGNGKLETVFCDSEYRVIANYPVFGKLVFIQNSVDR